VALVGGNLFVILREVLLRGEKPRASRETGLNFHSPIVCEEGWGTNRSRPKIKREKSSGVSQEGLGKKENRWLQSINRGEKKIVEP